MAWHGMVIPPRQRQKWKKFSSTYFGRSLTVYVKTFPKSNLRRKYVQRARDTQPDALQSKILLESSSRQAGLDCFVKYHEGFDRLLDILR